MFVPFSIPNIVSFLDDDGEDENPPIPTHIPIDDSIEHGPTQIPFPPKWVC
jgi:hypothetical protein